MTYDSKKYVNEGYHAYLNGVNKEDNPYNEGCNMHEDWNYGWDEGDGLLIVESELDSFIQANPILEKRYIVYQCHEDTIHSGTDFTRFNLNDKNIDEFFDNVVGVFKNLDTAKKIFSEKHGYSYKEIVWEI